ncbi:MAG: hypothetical protein ACI86H_002697, partial [bacterium]
YSEKFEFIVFSNLKIIYIIPLIKCRIDQYSTSL